MTNPNFAEEEDEKPLDPAMEKVRRKMVRLLFISSSAIVLALMAVLGSIVYKAGKKSDAARAEASMSELPAPAALQAITLPAGFVISDTSISGNRVLLFGKGSDGKSRAFVHDIGTGKPVTEIEIRSN